MRPVTRAVHGPPRLASHLRGRAQQVEHRLRASAHHVREHRAQLLVGTVSVDESREVFGGALRVSGRIRKRERLRGEGEVPRAGARGGAVPVDEHPAVAEHQIPRRQVVVADELLRRRREGRFPDRVGSRDVPRRDVMDAADHLAHATELGGGERCGVHRQGAGDELDDLPPQRVSAERLRRLDSAASHRLHIGDDVRGRGRPCLADGVPDPHDGSARIAALEDFLPHPPRLSERPSAEITPPGDAGYLRRRTPPASRASRVEI